MSDSSDVKVENPGIVTSDSLAGESVKQGGSFAEDSAYRGPMDQPSRSVNTNTTDTENATELESAPYRPARGDNQDYSELQSSSSGSGSAGRQGVSSSASEFEDRSQPRGNNLKEGGFDSDAPNASYTTDIGSKKDPGRVALQHFEEQNALNPVDGSVRDPALKDENEFKPLGGDTSA